MNQPENPSEQPAKKRSDILTLFCILTFIGSGLAAFSNLFIYLSFDEVSDILEEMDFNYPEFKMILSGGKTFFIGGFLLYTISLAGAMQMWKLKKIGFHFYTASQIFILLLPLVTIEGYPFSMVSLLVTIGFILAYFSQLKIMN